MGLIDDIIQRHTNTKRKTKRQSKLSLSKSLQGSLQGSRQGSLQGSRKKILMRYQHNQSQGERQRQRQQKPKRQSTAKYSNRPSPPFPANQYCGKTKRGNDGNYYTSSMNRNGICTWKKK